MKKIIAATLLAASAPTLYAASISSSCENQQFSLQFDVSDNETCTAEQTLTVNGSTSTETYDVMSGDVKNIPLSEGDSANLSVSLSCSTDFGTNTSSTGVGTANGCSGSSSTPEVPSVGRPPVTDVPPSTMNPIGGNSPIELLNRLVTGLVEDVTRQVESIQSSSIRNPMFTEARVRMVKRMTEIRLNSLERQFSDTESVALIDETRQMLNEMLETL